MTKPEAKAEETVETPTGRGRKRKGEEAATPATDKKAKKGAVAKVAEDDDTKEFSDYDSGGNNDTQPLRKRAKGGEEAAEEGKEAAKESPLTSRQQTAVAAALAAGVPGGQQRSVELTSELNLF